MVAVGGGRERVWCACSSRRHARRATPCSTAARWPGLRRVLARSRPHHAAVVRRAAAMRCRLATRRVSSARVAADARRDSRWREAPGATTARCANVIHAFKYQASSPLAAPLARAHDGRGRATCSPAPTPSFPVPLHPLRALRARIQSGRRSGRAPRACRSGACCAARGTGRRRPRCPPRQRGRQRARRLPAEADARDC